MSLSSMRVSMKLVAFSIAFVLVASITYAGSGALSEKEETFKSQTLQIKKDMNESDVISKLGPPAKILGSEDNDVRALGVTRGLVFWHPEIATVHLLVGISGGVVKASRMCSDVGSRVHITECVQVDEYWSK
jgi:hypothetical protein